MKGITMTRNLKYEIAVKSPGTIPETETETDLRIKAQQLYYQSGGRSLSGVSDYEAGWKAAKAYYQRELPTITEMSGLVHYSTNGKSMKEYMEELSSE